MTKKTPKNYLTKFDEINKFTEEMWINNISQSEFKDYYEDLLIDAYLSGFQWASDTIGDTVDNTTDIKTISSKDIDVNEVSKVINKSTAGKTANDRLNAHFDDFNTAGIKNTLETEYHRIFNESAVSTAKKMGYKYKTWVTMGDDKVRETHDVLEGVKVKIDEEFVTIDGDSAMTPGGFMNAENNCNCRCILGFGNN